MLSAMHTIRDEARAIVLFVGAIWVVFLLSLAVPAVDGYGLQPRTVVGLVGIFSTPFLHADLSHIVGNSGPLIVLLALLAGSKARSWEIVIDIVGLGGLFLWMFGRNANHIGASGLIFGLIGFLLVSGFLERRPLSMLVAAIVALLYGWTLLSAVTPWAGVGISWDGHLCGLIAGGLTAYALTREANGARRSAPELNRIAGR